MRVSKQLKKGASTLVAVTAAAAFLGGQPLIGTAMVTVAALLGVSALHRLGRQQEAGHGLAPLRAPIPSAEQRKRMLQEGV